MEAAVPDQQTIVLVNTFVSQCTILLDNFSRMCEDKLNSIDSKIRRMDATLALLEAKLQGIDAGATTVANPVALDALPDIAPGLYGPSEHDGYEGNASLSTGDVAYAEDQLPSTTVKVKDDARFAKFFKMLSVGVPVHGVKNQMQLEGVPPDILDTPDAPAPPL